MMAESENNSGSATLIGAEEGLGTTAAAPHLCHDCRKINLSVDKFLIGSRDSNNGPDGASDLVDATGKVRVASGSAKAVLGTVRTVRERCRICHVCELAYGAIGRYSGVDAVDENTRVYLTWEVDGRQRAPGTDRLVNRTRRIRLTWREVSGKEENAYLVFVAPASAHMLNSDAYATKATHTHFLGRGVFDTKERQALMRSWVDLCVDKHGPDCRTKHGSSAEFKKLLSSTYFGVIDVVDMQLKRLPVTNDVPERYVALSYVWGKRLGGQEPYMTKRENVMRHIQHGGLEKEWDKLPRTLQDSILLVSRLGERYIWIDSLCIVQDSNSSWELNAKAMHLVYGNAHFTICAADGDAETGLRAIASVLRTLEHSPSRSSGTRPVSMPASSSTPLSSHSRPRASSPYPPGVGFNGSNPTIGKGTHFPLSQAAAELRKQQRAADTANRPPLTAMCLPGIRLLVTRPAEAVIQDSPWNQRGWTFQERLLSRRCLIFAEGHVYFQCRSAVISQHIFTDGGGTDGWSLDWTNSPLRTLGELRRRAFWFYMKCIRLYTGRDLSKPKDILTAFQGATWLLEDRLNAPLFYGLPSSHFDLALLWMPLQKLGRRRQKPSRRHRSTGSTATAPPPTCTQDEMGNCSCRLEDDGFGARDFPSWSWCGWMGGKAEYPVAMIDGCLQNVQEWLLYHTWIQWHFRDHEGNLRPLWDSNYMAEDGSEEARWKGYTGRSGNLRPRFADRGSRRRAVTVGDGGGHRSPELRPTMGRDGWHRSSNVPYLERLPTGYYEEEAGDDYYATPEDDDRRRLSSDPSLRPRWRDGEGEWRPDVRQFTRNSTVPENPDAAATNDDVAEADRVARVATQRPNPRRPRDAVRPAWYVGGGYYGDASPYGVAPPYADFPSYGVPAPFAVQGPYYGTPAPYGPPLPPPPEYLRTSHQIPPAGRSRHPYARGGAHPGISRRDEYRGSRQVRNQHDDASSQSTKKRWDDESDGDNTDSASDRDNRSESTDRSWGHRPARDPYGRPIRPSIANNAVSKFTGLLPDDPFGVDRGPFDDRQGLRGAMSILQFWTWRTELLVTIREDQSPRELGQTPSGDDLCKCSISDKAGDWCGSITLARDWITGEEGRPLMFIALSDAKGFTEDECPVWNYYIPKEKEESEWDLYFVMLLDRNKERALWERVAVGKVFQAAFGDSVWDEIKLG